MCGIAGIYLFNKNYKERLQQIECMTDVLSHRGPDSKGYFINARVALGHRRLSIIDLSDNAKQPMFNEDGTLALVFNGEIYNFKELRELLIGKGHIFRSKTDSEVILHLYEEYDVECVKYLEGMFAFSIYDARNDTIYLTRDRVGEKPLYYFSDHEGIYFSSEIKSFFELNFFDKKLSPAGIHAYFNYIQIPAPQTAFDGVKKIRPGHWVLVKPDRSKTTRRYWHLDCTKKINMSEAEAKDRLKVLLLDSVKKMLVSDVPVGIMLSGGVDSSLILALSKEAGGQEITTFTVGNGADNTNDEEYIRARKIALKYNVSNYVFDYGESDFSELVCAAKLCDEPIGLLEIFYMFGISGKIKDHVKVVLNGNGADEIFGGYVTYNGIKRVAELTKIFKGIIRNNNHLFTSIAASYNVSRNWRVLNKLFSSEMKKIQATGEAERLLSDAMHSASFDNVLDAKLCMDLLVLCNHGMASIPDTSGMSHSIESRSPFLHHKVIEFGASLPLGLKVKDVNNPLFNKLAVRELACDYFDRESIFARKYGYGFFINTYSLIKTKWRSDIEDAIFYPPVFETGLFNKEYIKEIWSQFLIDKITFREKLTFVRYVMFCVWYKYNFSAQH